MNETTYVYYVHSDINENNIFAMFENEVDAIVYAKRHSDELTYVDKVEITLDEDGDYGDIIDSETIWVYDQEEPEDSDFDMTDDEFLDIDAFDIDWDEESDEDLFENLVEKLEEHEDMIECKECFELFPKADGIKIELGYICPHCHGHKPVELLTTAEDEIDYVDDEVFSIDFPETERITASDPLVPDVPNPQSEIGPNPQPDEPNPEPECVEPDCEAPVEAPVTKDETIIKLVVDEHEAIDGYDKAKVAIEANPELDGKEKEEILDTIEHIKEEEVEHIEELEELVDTKKEDDTENENDPISDDEVLTESKTLTEAEINYGKGINLFAGEQTKLDVLFSDKESPSKDGKILPYGDGYKLCIYNFGERNNGKFGITDIENWESYKLSSSVNEYNEIGAAKKDAEKLSKQLKDKTIGIYINEYEETNHPYLYLYKEGKITNNYAKDKIEFFENKYRQATTNTKPAATSGEQQENSTVTWSFADTSLTIKVGEEASIAVYKNNDIVTDKDFKGVNCAYKKVNDLEVSKLIKTTKASGGNIKFEVNADIYKELSPEIKTKLDNEGVILYLTVIEGGSTFRKAQCTIKVEKKTEDTVGGPSVVGQQSEEDNTQEPTQEALQQAYELLTKKFKPNEVKKYVQKVKDGKDYKYQPGPKWDDFKKKEQEIQTLINLLGESLEEGRRKKSELRLYDIFRDGEYIGQLKAYSEDDAIEQCYSDAFGFAYSDDMFTAELAEDEDLLEYFDEDSEEAENLLGCRITLEQIVSGLESRGYKAKAAVEEVSDEDSAFCYVRVVTPSNDEVSISLIPNGEILLDGDDWYGTIDYLASEYFNEDEEIFVRSAIEEINQFFKEEDEETVSSLTEARQKVSKESFKEMVKDQDDLQVAFGDPREWGYIARDWYAADLGDGRYELYAHDIDINDDVHEFVDSIEFDSFDEFWKYLTETLIADGDFILEFDIVSGDELTEHVNKECSAIESDQKLEGTDNAVVDCEVADVVTHSEDEKPVDCKGKKKPLEKPLTEVTHAQYAKPEGDRVAAYNNALKYAKKENKPFIYGYAQMGNGKFFALEQPIKVSGSPRDAEKEFRNKYKRCSVVYVVYPNKEFITEGATKLQEDASYVTEYLGYHIYKDSTGNKPYWCQRGYTDQCWDESFASLSEIKEYIKRHQNDYTDEDEYDDEDYDESLKNHSQITEAISPISLYKITPEEQAEYGIDDDGCSLDGFDDYVRCNWCEGIYTEYECKFEANLGWLCPTCQEEIRSHGGPLTIIELPTEEQIKATIDATTVGYIAMAVGDGDDFIYYIGYDEDAAREAVDDLYPDWDDYGLGGGDTDPMVVIYRGSDWDKFNDLVKKFESGEPLYGSDLQVLGYTYYRDLVNSKLKDFDLLY